MVKYHFHNEQIVRSNQDYIIQKSERERSLVVLANEYTQGKDRYREITLHLDSYLDEVLSVRFSHRDDIKLSLYFDEQENEETEDVEEAALFHMHNGELSMFSGTLADILVELDSFL